MCVFIGLNALTYIIIYVLKKKEKKRPAHVLSQGRHKSAKERPPRARTFGARPHQSL
jgi:hypothetical protein